MEIQRVKAGNGRQLTTAEKTFIGDQVRKLSILAIPVNQRTMDQDLDLIKLQKSIQYRKKKFGHDVLTIKKPVAKTSAQRKAESRARMALLDREGDLSGHEAWVESLVAPPEAPLTEAEQEREEMIARRRKFFEGLKSKYLE